MLLRLLRLLAGTACALGFCAAAPGESLAADPHERATVGLLADLEKLVELRSSLGWTVDRYEHEAMLPNALYSVCLASPEARSAALRRLDARIIRLGGPIEEAFRRNGRSLDGLGALTKSSRIRDLLALALERAPEDCPFWLSPDPGFGGVHTDAGRFTLSVEGGGLFLLQRIEGRLTPGGGGSGRLLLGRGFDTSWSLLVGGEFGGSALFKQTDDGLQFPIQFVAAVPVVLRRHNVSWHYDFELAPIAYFDQADTRPSWGGRVGGLIGVSTVRVRGFLPWAGLGLAAEYAAARSFRSATWGVKGGLRIGFDWDF